MDSLDLISLLRLNFLDSLFGFAHIAVTEETE